MSAYYFHLHNGIDLLRDPDGRDIADDKIVAAALREARAMISADASDGCIDLNQSIEVEDADGSVVHRLDFGDAVRIIASKAT
jgi:uncharacterized protein DUF6894